MRALKYFILKIRLLWYSKDPFTKLWVSGTYSASWNTILRKNVPCKNRLLRAKYCKILQLKVWNFKNLVSSKILSQCFRWRRGGIQAQNFFILEIRLLLYFKDTFAKLWFLTTPAAPCSTILRWTISYVKIQDSYSGEEKREVSLCKRLYPRIPKVFFLNGLAGFKQWQTCPINF